MANLEDEMSIAGRQSGLVLRIGMIVLALLVASGGLAGGPGPRRWEPRCQV